MFYGSYKAPRELLWMLGVVILLLMMATAFMGYVLPWGQMSFWGATVITNAVLGHPGGRRRQDRDLAVGRLSPSIIATLNRFFSLHYLLPFVICRRRRCCTSWALHQHGLEQPAGHRQVKGEAGQHSVPPLLHDQGSVLALSASSCSFFAYFVFFNPNVPRATRTTTFEANPMVTPTHIVPEWYFLPYYAMLRAVPSKLGGVCALFGSILILAFMPWLDTSRIRSSNFRPIYRAFLFAFFADVVVLGYCGSQEPQGAIVLVSQLATAWYFIHLLLITPAMGFFETPRQLPASITEAVLGPRMAGGSGAFAAARTAASPSVDG